MPPFSWQQQSRLTLSSLRSPGRMINCWTLLQMLTLSSLAMTRQRVTQRSLDSLKLKAVMTELEAVNTILATIGEAGVENLTTSECERGD